MRTITSFRQNGVRPKCLDCGTKLSTKTRTGFGLCPKCRGRHIVTRDPVKQTMPTRDHVRGVNDAISRQLHLYELIG